jgi:YHS domain-containing protein
MAKESGKPDQFDPICGRRFGRGKVASYTAEYRRRRYYFCSARCRAAFEKHLQQFRLGEMAKVGALLSPGRVSWGIA